MDRALPRRLGPGCPACRATGLTGPALLLSRSPWPPSRVGVNIRRKPGLGFSQKQTEQVATPGHTARPSARGTAALWTHRLPRLAVVSFVTRGAILTLQGQKQVPSPCRGAPEPSASPVPSRMSKPFWGQGQCAQRWGHIPPCRHQDGGATGRSPQKKDKVESQACCAVSTYHGAGLSGGAGVSGKADGALEPRERGRSRCQQARSAWTPPPCPPPTRTFQQFWHHRAPHEPGSGQAGWLLSLPGGHLPCLHFCSSAAAGDGSLRLLERAAQQPLPPPGQGRPQKGDTARPGPARCPSTPRTPRAWSPRPRPQPTVRVHKLV